MKQDVSVPERLFGVPIADTSPLNHLIRLGLAELLREIYGTIYAPRAVLSELSHPGAPTEVQRWAATPPSWMIFVAVEECDPTLPVRLGAGEREAITLAAANPGNLLVVDDYEARAVARDRKIQTTGTLALVRLGSLRGRLVFTETIASLRNLGFRLSRDLEDEVVKAHERETQ